MIVVLLASLQSKKVGRWLSPSLVNVAAGGITGMRVRPALSDWVCDQGLKDVGEVV
jgi:hypothetical protein